MRPWTATRQLLAVAAVAALTLLAPGLPPTPAAFAHDTPRVTPSRPPSPTAQAKVELEGTLEIIHEDRDDGSGEYHHTLLTDDGARWALDGVPHGRDLLTGDRVRIKGHEQTRDRVQASDARVQQAVALSQESSSLAAVALAYPNTLGPQSTAVILVSFQDNPAPTGLTAQNARSVVLSNDPTSVSSYFREASYGQTWLTGDVVRPIRHSREHRLSHGVHLLLWGSGCARPPARRRWPPTRATSTCSRAAAAAGGDMERSAGTLAHVGDRLLQLQRGDSRDGAQLRPLPFPRNDL